MVRDIRSSFIPLSASRSVETTSRVTPHYLHRVLQSPNARIQAHGRGRGGQNAPSRESGHRKMLSQNLSVALMGFCRGMIDTHSSIPSDRSLMLGFEVHCDPMFV